MPAGLIEDQHELLGGTGARLARKGGEFGLEEGDAHARRQMKQRPTRRRMDKAHEVAPFVAVLDRSEGTVPVDTPDLVQKWLQANAVFVDRPQLEGTVREGRGDFAEERAQSRLEGRLRQGICPGMTGARLEETRSDLS